MTISDEDVQAYVDGELPPQDVVRVEAAIAADVLVAARVERERRLRSQLRGAYAPVLEEPVPSRLSDLLTRRDADDVTPLRERRPTRNGRWRTAAIALAASVAALAIAQWLRAPGGDVAVQRDRWVARGELARELDRALASEAGPGSAVAIGLTFRAVDGHVCRSFIARRAHLAGLACREGDAWALPVLSRSDATDAGELRRAASAMSPEVQAAIDARLQGDAFDAAQERQSRDAGWR